MDVLDRADLPFPHSLPEFQRLFPDDAACAAYLEKARWGDGFACPHCGTAGEPFHFENRPGVLRCRKCRQNTGLTVGTVMERSHTPLNVWFWAAYLVASQTPGMSAVQFQRQLGLSRYETAFQIGVYIVCTTRVQTATVPRATVRMRLRLPDPCRVAAPVVAALASLTRQ